MNASIFHHIILIASLYTVLFISNYGWGVFASKILKFNLDSLKGCFFYTVWIGWCTTLFVFQLIHLFFAIDWKASCIIYLAGIAFPIGATKNIFAKAKELFAPDNRSLLISFLASISCIAIWVIFRGMKAPENYDSGLYHFNSIRWINSYPIVPGLGNLHSRLAFNQSFFVYAASLNFFPYFPYAHSVANAFLFMLVMAEVIWRLAWLVQNWHNTVFLPVQSFVPYVFVFFIAIWWVVIGWSGVGEDISSPTPDFASFLIQLVLFLWLIQFIYAVRDQRFQAGLAASLTILAATLITVKLSNLIFAGSLIGICTFYAMKSIREKDLLKPYGNCVVLILGITLTWIIRGYFSSGYPFYPASFGGLSFSWSMPVENVREMGGTISSWARTPGHDPNNLPGNAGWMRPWLLLIYNEHKPTVVYPLSASLILIIFYFMISINTTRLSFLRSNAILFVPVLAGLSFWFFSAPEPRFANALFFLLLLNALILFASGIYDLADKQKGFILAKITTFVFAVVLLRSCYPIMKYDFQSTYYGPPLAALNEKRTDSGLWVYTPQNGDQCWDALLPCTPYYNPKLRLIVNGDLASGFTVK